MAQQAQAESNRRKRKEHLRPVRSQQNGSNKTQPDGHTESQCGNAYIQSWLQQAIAHDKSHAHEAPITNITPDVADQPVRLVGVEQPHAYPGYEIAPQA